MITTYTRNNKPIWGRMKEFNSQGGFDAPVTERPVGRNFFVDTINGSNGNVGRSYDSGYLTLANALAQVDDFDTIWVQGVIKEQVVTPAGVHDVSIIGAGNQARQATDGGVATGGGSTWLVPASPAASTALLRIIGQGWKVQNIQMVPHTSSACVEVERNAGPPERDGGHFSLIGCRLVGGTTANGLVFKGGGYNCKVVDNDFESLAGTAILSNGTGVSVPQFNKILNNRFNGCGNSIAISSVRGFIIGNIIKQAADDANNKVNLVSVSGQGSDNMVIDNIFSDAAANVSIAKGYKPGTSDIWRNFVTDTAAYIVTVPA